MRFLFSLGAYDRLGYFIVAIPGSSMYLFWSEIFNQSIKKEKKCASKWGMSKDFALIAHQAELA